MSLTWKLVLGFLFALVLQVCQMAVSAYFMAQMQAVTMQVSSALTSNLAVQRGVDAVVLLRGRTAKDLADDAAAIDLSVYHVYLEEVGEQVGQFAASLPQTASTAGIKVMAALDQANASLAALEVSAAGELRERVSFLEDHILDLEQAMLRAQCELRESAIAGVAREREMHDLPVRAGWTITLVGIVLMAVFVAWFSRQLVIPIERAWSELEIRVAERTAELDRSVSELEEQIAERQRVEVQKEALSRQLIEASRTAGMAELANGVLHNVGNVLNSVNTSATLLLGGLRQTRVEGLSRALVLLRDHEHELADYLTNNEQGQKLHNYLDRLAEHLVKERDALAGEANELLRRVNDMMQIVGRQQSYARVSGCMSVARLSAIVEDALSMHTTAFAQMDVSVSTTFEFDDEIELDRSRVMQILMNLITNAKHAMGRCEGGGNRLEVRVVQVTSDRVRLTVRDSGIGIAAEDLTKIFGHGFTTKSEGHGFGLHHSANAASEMGGRLWVESEGLGKGATFALELPIAGGRADPAAGADSIPVMAEATQ